MTLASETTTTTTATTATTTANTANTVQLQLTDGWFTVCDLAVLMPGRGVAALLPDGHQVALFLDRTGRMYAIDNRDPFSGAAVLSRGLTGTHQGRPFVASPLLKQRFDLESGQCLDDETVRVATYEVRAR
ncbi:nitrite reductase small subunit NirD [Streptomyces sp. 2-1]|uniref:nitrite reductase small subunit NirD n=1 Tax=Streptomyces sp. 2-1 TaxID=412710 RepID=UPI003AFAA28D